jgi:hypothetical protein
MHKCRKHKDKIEDSFPQDPMAEGTAGKILLPEATNTGEVKVVQEMLCEVAPESSPESDMETMQASLGPT